MFNKITRKTHRRVSLLIAVVAVILTPLLVMGVIPGYVGVMAFVAVAAWIAIGATASRSAAWVPSHAHTAAQTDS